MRSPTTTLGAMDSTPTSLLHFEGNRSPVAHAMSILTAQQTDISCLTLKEDLLIQAHMQHVIGTDADTPEFVRCEDWI